MLHTLTQFQTLNVKLSEYQQRDINEAVELCELIKPFYPCSVKVDVSTQEGQLYYQLVYVMLDGDLNLSVKKSKDKFVINCYFALDTIRNVSGYTRNEVYKQVPEPVKIGVLSTKKIQAWVDYYTEVYRRLLSIDSENQNKKAAFLKSIEGLPVEWFNNNKSGTLVKNGIEYTFKIEDEYVSENIKLHYSVYATLDNFLKLSDNKFKKK